MQDRITAITIKDKGIDIKKITADFEEIKTLINLRQKYLIQINKLRRQLKSQFRKYAFLEDLVGINSNGSTLVNSLIKYFHELGFKHIENVDKKYKDEDIRLWHDDRLLIFEVTGIDTANPKDDKVHQISKHIPVRQEQNPNLKVFGVFVINHDNSKPFDKREKKIFREGLIDIAKAHKYTLVTTVDLLNAFISIKKGDLLPIDLIDALCITGKYRIEQ